MKGILPLRHAAVQAGLGEIALSNLFTTPQFGPRVRLVSIVTEAELDPDQPYEDKLCEKTQPTCNLACIRNYPVHAISEKGIIDKYKCLHYQEQIMPWSAVELRCGMCVGSCPIGERKWSVPAGSRSEKVKEMKDLWKGAKW